MDGPGRQSLLTGRVEESRETQGIVRAKSSPNSGNSEPSVSFSNSDGRTGGRACADSAAQSVSAEQFLPLDRSSSRRSAAKPGDTCQIGRESDDGKGLDDFRSDPTLPFLRVAGGVDDGQNQNAFGENTKVNDIREPFNECLAHVAVNNGEPLRVTGDGAKLNRTAEMYSLPRPFRRASYQSAASSYSFRASRPISKSRITTLTGPVLRPRPSRMERHRPGSPRTRLSDA